MPVRQKIREPAEIPRDSPRKRQEAEFLGESPRKSRQKKTEKAKISSPPSSRQTREQAEEATPRMSLPPPPEMPTNGRQKNRKPAETPRDSPRKRQEAEFLGESPRKSRQKKTEKTKISSPPSSRQTREQAEEATPRMSLPPPPEMPTKGSYRPPSLPQCNHDKSFQKQRNLGSKPPITGVLTSTSSFASTDTVAYHPPALGLVQSPIKRSLSPLTWAPTSHQRSIMYFPPVSNETDSEAEAEVDRYLAALGHQVYSASHSTTFVPLSIETTETDLTGEDKGNNKKLSISRGSTYEERSRGLLSIDSEATSQNFLVSEFQESAEGDYFRVKQSFGYCATVIMAIQLCVLMLQLTLCGVAPLDVNPMVGPYPDVFSEWGGKNAYLLLAGRQYWRFVTPLFLHVGVLHLLCNAVVQLETCAFFEREWGSKRWMIIYILSEVGCIVVSCVVDPDTLAVGSSGAMMGLFGAKFAQIITYSVFELVASYEPHIRMEQLSGILCSLSIISILSVVTYIDWSGHMGGFGTGFCVGMVAFSTPIRSGAIRFVWNVIGLGLLGTGAYYSFQALFMTTEPDEDLADPCNYFRNLYAEGYNCECVWG